MSDVKVVFYMYLYFVSAIFSALWEHVWCESSFLYVSAWYGSSIVCNIEAPLECWIIWTVALDVPSPSNVRMPILKPVALIE